MKIHSALWACTALAGIALPHLAAAQPVTGPYVSLGAGYNFLTNGKLKPIGATGTGQFRSVFDGGYMAAVSGGFGLGGGLRAEVEGDYYHNSLSKLEMPGSSYKANGSERKYGVMVNTLYDFDLGAPIYPYAGAGFGLQYADLRNFGFNDAGTGIAINNYQINPAYQFIAGFAVDVPGVSGLALTADYRFLGLIGPRQYYGNATSPGSQVGGFFKAGQDYNNTVMLGLRYQLFQPAPQAAAPVPVPVPVPMAAPAPAAARTFLVFFDWDKADLTPRATQIISQAAAESHQVQVTTIDVSGYTDTSGTASYNKKLSLRRANNVAAQLVADGVAKSEIAIMAFGETHLLVATGPGVREPQNRRVEIVLK